MMLEIGYLTLGGVAEIKVYMRLIDKSGDGIGDSFDDGFCGPRGPFEGHDVLHRTRI